MIYNLQILRGFAATAVAFYHTAFLLPGGLHSDFFGVPTFFVISGFIMCLITRQDSERFLLKRIVRIVPLYWLCTVALVILTCKLPAELLGGELPGDLLHGLFFIPYRNPPVLGVGWTLNYEIYFYALFALALVVSQRFAPILTAAVILAVVAIAAAAPGMFLLDYYSHHYVMYFVAGIALFYLASVVPPLGRLPAALICGGAVVVVYGSQFIQPFWAAGAPGSLFGPALAGFPVVLVGAALWAEKSGAIVRSGPLILLGDASYALYLVHPILYKIAQSQTLRHSLPAPEDHLVLALAYVTTSILVAIVVHLAVERPMLARMRGWIARRSRAGAGARPAPVLPDAAPR